MNKRAKRHFVLTLLSVQTDRHTQPTDCSTWTTKTAARLANYQATWHWRYESRVHVKYTRLYIAWTAWSDGSRGIFSETDICRDTGVQTRDEPRHLGLDWGETKTTLKYLRLRHCRCAVIKKQYSHKTTTSTKQSFYVYVRTRRRMHCME